MIVKVLRESYDHNVYVIEQGGERRVLKVVTDPAAQPNLEREVTYCGLLHSLVKARPDFAFRTAPIRAFGDGWFIRELIDAPLLIDPDRAHPQEYERAAPRWARVLADFNRIGPSAGRPTYRDPSGQPVASEQDRLDELEGWVAASLGALPDSMGEQTLDYLRATIGDVQLGFEMWDVKPEDFLDLDDGKVGVHDLEFAHLLGRRYYDLAKLYSILRLGLGLASAAVRLLSEFVELQPLPPRELARAALPVFAAEALGQLQDAVQTGEDDGVVRAQGVLGRCLSGEFSSLLAP